MNVQHALGARIEDLQGLIAEAEADSATKAIMVLGGDENGWDPASLNPVLSACTKPVFGGLFPRLIFGESLLDKGMIVVGLPYAVDVSLVRGLSDGSVDFEDIIDGLVPAEPSPTAMVS